MIESELGRSVDEMFASFEPTAMASASIAQVHRATTQSGRRVVVKVQHPGIEERIVNDLEIMGKLAELAEERSEYLRQFRPLQTTREFRKTLMQELDFGRELRNLQRFRETFKEDALIRFPEPHPDLSSRRVLTMDLLEGISASNKEDLAASGQDLAEIARRGASLFLNMIFRDGFYHADPHPDNLMVLTDVRLEVAQAKVSDSKSVIGVLDCGKVARLDDSLRADLETALIAAVDQDWGMITEMVARICELPAEIDESALRNGIEEFLDEYTHQSMDEFDLRSCLKGIIEGVRNHRMVLPAKVAMLLKVLVVLEGTAQQLNPAFSLAELMRPYAEKAISRRYSPERLVRRLKAACKDWDNLFRSLPKDAANILHNVKCGKFDMHLEHRRLEPIVNRLVLGILTAALFVGSASLCDYQVPPVIRTISVPGFLGCFVAIAMGWSIIRAIHRSKR